MKRLKVANAYLVNKEALAMSEQLINLFISEAIEQSKNQASIERSGKILKVDHLQKVLPRLLLDF